MPLQNWVQTIPNVGWISDRISPAEKQKLLKQTNAQFGRSDLPTWNETSQQVFRGPNGEELIRLGNEYYNLGTGQRLQIPMVSGGWGEGGPMPDIPDPQYLQNIVPTGQKINMLTPIPYAQANTGMFGVNPLSALGAMLAVATGGSSLAAQAGAAGAAGAGGLSSLGTVATPGFAGAAPALGATAGQFTLPASLAGVAGGTGAAAGAAGGFFNDLLQNEFTNLFGQAADDIVASPEWGDLVGGGLKQPTLSGLEGFGGGTGLTAGGSGLGLGDAATLATQGGGGLLSDAALQSLFPSLAGTGALSGAVGAGVSNLVQQAGNNPILNAIKQIGQKIGLPQGVLDTVQGINDFVSGPFGQIIASGLGFLNQKQLQDAIKQAGLLEAQGANQSLATQERLFQQLFNAQQNQANRIRNDVQSIFKDPNLNFDDVSKDVYRKMTELSDPTRRSESANFIDQLINKGQFGLQVGGENPYVRQRGTQLSEDQIRRELGAMEFGKGLLGQERGQRLQGVGISAGVPVTVPNTVNTLPSLLGTGSIANANLNVAAQNNAFFSNLLDKLFPQPGRQPLSTGSSSLFNIG